MSARDPRTAIRPPAPTTLTVNRDFAAGRTTITKTIDPGRTRNDRTGWESASHTLRSFEISDLGPLSANYATSATVEFGREGAVDTKFVITNEMTASREDFHVTASLAAYEDGRKIFEKTWDEKIPRDNV